MYKHALLNSTLNRIAGNLGHTDRICIADCGLPIPQGVERVDLALKQGVPGFWEVMTEMADHLVIEKVLVADEMEICNKALYRQICEYFSDIPVEKIPHDEFKQQTGSCVAVVRTGEIKPYANIILQAGCLFS